jgi:diacylglycerol kinase family enzyme
VLSYKPPLARVAVNGDEAREARALLMVIGNGQYFGGGMQVAPEARLDDGALDLVALIMQPLPVLLANFHRLYAGSHLHLPWVETGRGERVHLEADQPLLLEIDGEQPGTTPATFEVLPAALRVISPD